MVVREDTGKKTDAMVPLDFPDIREYRAQMAREYRAPCAHAAQRSSRVTFPGRFVAPFRPWRRVPTQGDDHASQGFRRRTRQIRAPGSGSFLPAPNRALNDQTVPIERCVLRPSLSPTPICE